jgi:hypothetical protein
MPRRTEKSTTPDKRYLQTLLTRIRVCKRYRPKFGQGRSAGLSLQEFQDLYRSDIFYAWFGLDNPLMYAAHKAAGGITSVYRQIGIGCEEVFRQVLQDNLGLDVSQSKWSYEVILPNGHARRLSLDGRIELADVTPANKRTRVQSWMAQACTHLRIAPEIASVLKGAVFEVRQGYKSKDSKRQNADIANAATAYSQGYLPVVIVLSSQIDSDIVARYEHEKWLILRGMLSGSPVQSTYSFSREVIGYDLEMFFRSNSISLKKATEDVLKTLLKANE